MANRPGPLKTIYSDPEKLDKSPAATRVVLENYWRSNCELVDPLREKRSALYNRFRSYVEIDEDEIRSDFSVPVTAANILSYVPRVVANNPQIQVWEQEPNDAALAAMHRAQIIKDWRGGLNMPFELVPYATASLVWGTAMFKVYNRREVRMRSRRVNNSMASARTMLMNRIRASTGMDPLPAPAPTFEDKPALVYNGAAVDVLDPDEYYPDPESRRLDDSWIIHERPTNWDTIRAEHEADPGKYNSEVVNELKRKLEGPESANPASLFSKTHQQTLKQRQLQTFGPERVPLSDPYKRQITLLEKTTADQVVTVVLEYPELAPLRVERNRYGMVNYVKFTPIPDPMNSFDGLSLVEMLYSLNLELDMLHNARMDHILGSIYPMFGTFRGSGLNAQNVRWRPWGILEMDGPEDLWPLKVPEMNRSSYREAEEVRQMMQMVGAPDQMMGLDTGGSSTATEVNFVNQASSSKAGLMYHILTHQALNRFGKLLVKNNELYKTEADFVRLTGREFAPPRQVDPMTGQEQLDPGEVQPGLIRVDPDVLGRGFASDPDLIIDVASTEPVTRQTRAQRGINALQIAGQIPPEAWQNPVVARAGVLMLQGLGDDFAHETVASLRGGVPAHEMIQQRTAPAAGPTQSGVQTEGQQLAVDNGGSSGQ